MNPLDPGICTLETARGAGAALCFLQAKKCCIFIIMNRSPLDSVPNVVPHHHVLLIVLEHNQNFKGLG